MVKNIYVCVLSIIYEGFVHFNKRIYWHEMIVRVVIKTIILKHHKNEKWYVCHVFLNLTINSIIDSYYIHSFDFYHESIAS